MVRSNNHIIEVRKNPFENSEIVWFWADIPLDVPTIHDMLTIGMHSGASEAKKCNSNNNSKV